MSNQKQIKHLFARAGFGLRFEDLHADSDISIKKAVKKLFKSSENDEPIAIVNDTLNSCIWFAGLAIRVEIAADPSGSKELVGVAGCLPDIHRPKM